MATPLFSRASGFGNLFAMVELELGPEAVRQLRRQSGFGLDAYPSSLIVPFPIMNRAYNLAARMSGDDQFGARVGADLRIEALGPFVEYSLRGETLAEVIARTNSSQRLHTNALALDLSVADGRARWRLRCKSRLETSVESLAQRSLMLMFQPVRRMSGAGEIEFHVAEPYSSQARKLEGWLGLKVHARADDYGITFPAPWLGNRAPLADRLAEVSMDALASYGNQQLPRAVAESVLVALALHEDLPAGGLDATADELGLAPRTLQRALRREGVTYRQIVLGAAVKRAEELLATSDKPLTEVALRAGYSDPSNFHRAFRSQTGVTPGRFREAMRRRAHSLS